MNGVGTFSFIFTRIAMYIYRFICKKKEVFARLKLVFQ